MAGEPDSAVGQREVQNKARQYWPYYAIVAGVLLGGASPVLIKLLLNSGLTGPMIVALRYVLAMGILLPAAFWPSSARPTAPPTRRDWIALIAMGVLSSGIGSLLFVKAVDLASAGVVNALSKMQPIFVALLAYFALRERISSLRFSLIGMMVLAGILIAWGEFNVGAAEHTLANRLLGDVLGLGAGVARAVAEILGKRCVRRFRARTVAAMRFGAGLVVTGTVVIASGGLSLLPGLTAHQIALLIVLGVLCSAVSMALYYWGLRDVEAHVAASLRLLGAVVTVVLSVLILHDTFNPFHVAGISILLFGAYLIVVRTTRSSLLDQFRALGVDAGVVPDAPELGADRRPVPMGLKLKIAIFAVFLILATVLPTSVLSIRHTTKVIEEEVRLTMAKTASTIGALAQVPLRPSWQTYQQYVETVARSQIRGKAYSIEIVYIAVLDRAGNIRAFAFNPDVLELRDSRGRSFRSGDLRGAAGLLDMAEAGELGAKGVLRATAVLRPQTGDEVQGRIDVGYKKSIAQQAINRIRNRDSLLALLLTSLGILLAIWLAGSITGPLERLTAAMRRVQRGDLEVSVIPETRDEVGLLGQSFNEMVEGLRKKVFLENTLRRYVSLQVAEQIIAEGRDFFAPQRRKVTVMFADLRGFTPLAEQLKPEEVFEMLNEYFGIMVESIFKYDGMIDKYMGDCVMAVWGAWREEEQDDALRAVLAALEMRRALRRLNKERERAGKKRITAGAGINTGVVTAGSLGASTETITQWEYAVIGDHVNVAQRLESKTDGYQIFISQSTYEEVKEHVIVEQMPPMALKGKRVAVPVYAVIGLQGEPDGAHEHEPLD